MPVDWNSIDKSSLDQLRTAYERYGKFGDDTFKGDNITLTNIDKWFNETGAFGEKFSTAESSIAFKKIAGTEKTISFDQFKEFIAALVDTKNPQDANAEIKKILNKLQSRSQPGLNNTTTPDASAVVDRLTDPAGFTGTQRFAADGKAVEGQALPDQPSAKNDGYVAGYKNADTYDREHNVQAPKYDAEEERKRIEGRETDTSKKQTDGRDTDVSKKQNEGRDNDASKKQNDGRDNDASKKQTEGRDTDASKKQTEGRDTDVPKKQ